MFRWRLLPFALPLLTLPLLIALIAAIGRPPIDRDSMSAQWSEILTGNFSADDTNVDECEEATREIACYAQAFGNIAFREGGAVAMRRLLEASTKAEGALTDCHPVAHLVGSAAYYRLENDFAAAIADGTRECSGGYYHGVISAETASAPAAEPEALGERLGRLCRMSTPDLGVRSECYHGIGHVAEHLYDYETPTALLSCQSMRDSIEALGADDTEITTSYFSCAQGVFMENRMAMGGPEGRWRREDDSTFPCSEFDEPTGIACWDTVPTYLDGIDDLEPDEKTALRFATCAEAELVSWSDRCVETTRRLLVSERIGADEIVVICADDPGGIPACLQSISSEAVIRWSDLSRAAPFCDAADDPLALNACGVGIGEGLRYVSLELERCNELSEALVGACREGYVRMSRQLLPMREGE